MPARAYCPFNKPQYPSPSLRRISRNEMHWFHSRVRLGSCIARNIHQQLWICGGEGRDRARKKNHQLLRCAQLKVGAIESRLSSWSTYSRDWCLLKAGDGRLGCRQLTATGVGGTVPFRFHRHVRLLRENRSARGCNSSFIKVRAWKGWKG